MEQETNLQRRNFSFFNLRGYEKEKVIEYAVIGFLTVFLFFFALYSKNLFNEWYWSQEGTGFYWHKTEGKDEIVWYIEGYVDASYYYEPYLYAFRFQNWNPYSGGEGPLNGYAYGILFIYGIYFISLFVGLFNPNFSNNQLVAQSVKWSHLIFDSLCVSMLYLIIINLKCLECKKYYKHLIGLLVASIYIWMPFNLIYIDSYYLNIPQMTFFVLVSLFLFMKKNYRWSSFFLSIAWLSKQMALFLLIPWILILWKKENKLYKALLDFFVPFLLTTLIFSVPWIFLEPYGYMVKLFGPGNPVDVVSLDPKYNGYTVTLAHSFLKLGSETLAYAYNILNKYMIPFVFFYLIYLFIAYFNASKIYKNEEQFILYTTLTILVTHVFISRGLYKYYNAFITPFYLLSAIVLFVNFLNKIQISNDSESSSKDDIKKQKPPYSLLGENIVTKGFLVIYLLSFSIILYYVNFIIIIQSRFLHPLYLCLIFIFCSTFLDASYYKSLTIKSNYHMIWADLKTIFGDIKALIKPSKKVK